MLGLLEGYFVPLYQFHYNPVGFDEKVPRTCLKLHSKFVNENGSKTIFDNRLTIQD
jgi:hypothetical protein